MPTTSIAIICTLDELIACSRSDTNQKRHFSLNLSVGLRGDPKLPLDAVAMKIFQPWQLTSIALNAYADEGQPGDPITSGKKIASVKAITIPQADVSTVKARLEKRFGPPSAGREDYYHWSDDPLAPTAVSGETWPRVLAHASTYAAPVPLNINLSILFTIDAADIADCRRLFVAPAISTDNATTFDLGTSPENPAKQTSEWKYATAPAGYASMSAFQGECALTDLTTAAGAPRFIDLNTGWIATSGNADQMNPPESLASEDWRASLERRAGEAFDFGQRLLVAWRSAGALQLTFHEVDTVRDAVLAALYDTADTGLRYGPDGTNLFRFVASRAGVADPGPLERELLKASFDNQGHPLPSLSDWKLQIANVQIGKAKISIAVAVVSGKAGDPATVEYLEATLNMLDTVQSALATDSFLAEVIFAQWDSLLTSAEWTKVKADIQGTLQKLAGSGQSSSTRLLRGRMLLANMGGVAPTNGNGPVSNAVPVWAALTNTAGASTYDDEVKKVIANLQGLAKGYFLGRFGLDNAGHAALFTNRAPAASWPLDNSKPKPDLTSALQDDAATFQASLFPATDVSQLASHPVILQIGDTNDTAKSLIDDFERKISGIGLLIQEENLAWTCANVANLHVAGGNTPIRESAAAPVRLKTRNKLRQPFLSYNSASLVAQDVDDPRNTGFAQGEIAPGSEPLFQYRLDAAAGDVLFSTDNQGNFTLKLPLYVAPGDDVKDWARIPSLKFGKTYNFLPFVISSGGTLPPLLAESLDNPFGLAKPSVFKGRLSAGNSVLKGYRRSVTYKRRVAIGAPRLKFGAGGVSHDFPAVPPPVVPLTRDYLGNDSNPAPLLLLWPHKDHSSFTFGVRPPSCDLETWDRWIASLDDAAPQTGTSFRNNRMIVAAAIGLFSPKNVNDPDTPDISIDDPAVVSLTFALKPVYSGGANAPGAQTWTPTPPAPLSGTISGTVDQMRGVLMRSVQSNGVTIKCSIDAQGKASLALDGDKVTVTTPEGEIWRLTITPDINDAGKARLETFVHTALPFEILIETATAGLFAPNAKTAAFQETLWKQLSVARQDPGKDPALEISFAPWGDRAQIDPQRDLLRRIDLRRQAWRWTGRPVAPLPADWQTAPGATPSLDSDPAMVNGVPNSRLWEVGSFAERPDDDCIVNQVAVNFALKDTAPVKLLSLDLSHDPRAQFYRFSIDVHSRYEGLPGLTLAPIRARKFVQSGGYTDWKRQVVPPRVIGEIPKPKVLLTIPLTMPDQAESSILPDLLVVASEPMFCQGGLAEQLHAELELARDPSVPMAVPLDQANPIPEVGPNPILSKSAIDPKLLKPGDSLPAEPVGTTFDLNTAAPLFGNTCYRLRSSMMQAAKNVLPADGLEHYMTRVRFTRRIDQATFTTGTALLESKPTDPFWVEFQSSFSHCSIEGNSEPIAIADLTFSIANGSLEFRHKGAAVKPIAGPPPSAPLELWALLMRSIWDVTGTPQTVAVNLVGPGFKTTEADNSDFVVFLLEILKTPEYKTMFTEGIGNAAALLFPPADPNTGIRPNTSVRINRCSPLISHVS